MEVAWARVCRFKSAHYSVTFVTQPAYTICMVVLLLSPTLSHSCLEDGRFPTHQNQLLILTSYPVLSFLVFSSDLKKNLSAWHPMCLGKHRNSGNAWKKTFFSSGDVPLILSYILSCMRDYRFPTHQNQLLNSYHHLFFLMILAPGLNCVQRFLKFGTSTFAHEAILRNHFSSYLI